MYLKDVVKIVLWCIVFWFSKFQNIVCSDFPIADSSIQPMWNATFTDKLRKDLLKNYDRFARPSQHYNTTVVELSFTLRHIEINEEKATMTINVWITMAWEDTKLKWNPEDYGGLKLLHLSSYELWNPNLFLHNGIVVAPLTWTSAGLLVYPTGQIIWLAPGRLSALCDLDMTYWPYDTQSCYFKIGSWTDGDNEIELGLFNDKREADLDDILTKNNQWTILNTKAVKTTTYYHCCVEGYPDVSLTVNVTRISPSTNKLVITPTFVIIVSSLVTFWISPHGNGKFVMNGFAFLIVCGMLLYFTSKLPSVADRSPLIILFYSNCLYLLSFAMAESTLVIWMAKSFHLKPLPWIVRRQLKGRFGSILGVVDHVQQVYPTNYSNDEEVRNHQVTSVDADLNSMFEESLQQEWTVLAAVIDRLCFLVFILIFITMSTSYYI